MEQESQFDSTEFRHNLIQNEFGAALTSKEYEADAQTDGIIVLSAKEFVLTESGEIDFDNTDNQENIARIEVGIMIAKKIVAEKTGKNLDEIEESEISEFSPLLVLNGTINQLAFMREVATTTFHFPVGKIRLVDCGKPGVGNTKTQFEVVNDFAARSGQHRLTFVTSDYHLPRVERTAAMLVDPALDYDVVQVPHADGPEYNVFRTVKGEVKRILRYSEKGDIARDRPKKTD